MLRDTSAVPRRIVRCSHFGPSPAAVAQKRSSRVRSAVSVRFRAGDSVCVTPLHWSLPGEPPR